MSDQLSAAARRRGRLCPLVLLLLSGCDLVVLEAAGDDWPRHWYARRGFEEIGRTWAVDRPA